MLGYAFEASVTLEEPAAALAWASGLERRGMRQIRIRDTSSGVVFDERSFRAELKRLESAE